MCNQDINVNKGCYLPPDTYLGIYYVPYHPGCLVILVTPPWTHTLWYGDLYLSGVYVCFPTQGNSSVFPSLIFQNKIRSSSYACLSKSTITLPASQNMTLIFACIPR